MQPVRTASSTHLQGDLVDPVHLESPLEAGARLFRVTAIRSDDAAERQALHVAGVGRKRPSKQRGRLRQVTAPPLAVRKDEERVHCAARSKAVDVVATDREGQLKQPTRARRVPVNSCVYVFVQHVQTHAEQDTQG